MPEFIGRPNLQEGLMQLVARLQAERADPIAQGIQTFARSIGGAFADRGQAVGDAAARRMAEERAMAGRRASLMEVLATHGALENFDRTGTIRDGQRVWDKPLPDGAQMLSEMLPGMGFQAGVAYRPKTEKDKSSASGGKSGSGKPGGKILPAATVINLNEGKNVARLLPEVELAIKSNEKIFGPVEGRARSLNPYDTGAKTVDARLRTASQAFGKFMEGGVLRKEDEEKYRLMFPQLSDTVEVARNKLAIVRRQLIQKYNDDVKTEGGSGYDISGFEVLDIPPSVFEQRAEVKDTAPAAVPKKKDAIDSAIDKWLAPPSKGGI